jgi:signal transduction histidine kinase
MIPVVRPSREERRLPPSSIVSAGHVADHHEADLQPTLARAAQAMRARAAAVIVEGNLVGAVGPAKWLAPSTLRAVAAGGEVPRELAGCQVLSSPVREHGNRGDVLLIFREAPFTEADDAIAAVLAEAVGAVWALTERTRLFRRLSRIQQSISHRAPLQEVLDGITAGLRDLLGDSLVGLRLIDPDDPGTVQLVSSSGLTPEQEKVLARSPVGEGAGGRAIAEDALVVITDYESSPDGMKPFREQGLAIAMAAPIHSAGAVVGSVTSASFLPHRRYSSGEQEVLLAFAEHASIALNDAQALEAMREAERAKELFLAMVSHELKTPLTVMMGTLRTLAGRRERLDEATIDRMLEAAFERGRDLEVLINQLLESARAELASDPVERGLPGLIASALSGFEHLRTVRYGPIPDVTVHTDPAAFRAIIGILLENALSHAPATTEVLLSAEVGPESVSVTVANEGSLPGDLDNEAVFQPFRRGEREAASGVGLGLYIARRLASALPAALACETGDDQVRFILTLPHRCGPATS